MCLNGQCRSSVYDCPQDKTCPPSLPIQCKDGQCSSTSGTCSSVDDEVYTNLMACIDQNLLLCGSDLVTCSASQELCPTLSTCPFGYTKCTESLCINPLTDTCPSESTNCPGIIQNTSFYCRETQKCVGSFSTCPTISTCPFERPVKCAADLSCRESSSLCPATSNQSSNGLGASTNLAVCLADSPVKCEDGSC